MKIYKPYKGFTLLELAIVIIIIGLFISIAVGGNKLILLGKLKAAKEATKSAPIHGIDDGNQNLVAWFETSLDGSVTKDATGAVSKWHNRAINNKKHATQTIAANQPIFTKYAINGVPALKFDGTNDFFTMLPTLKYGDDDYTIITVWQSHDNAAMVIWEQNSNSSSAGDRAALIANHINTFGFNGQNNDQNDLGTYNLGESIIGIAVVQNDGTVDVYDNGAKASGSISNTTANVKTDTSFIGKKVDNSGYFDGYIAEIIVYNKPLSDNEIKNIHKYLSKKYDIEIK